MEVTVECVCGETLKAEGETRKLAGEELEKLYRGHLSREDHQNTPAQWAEAYNRIEKAK